MMRRCDLAWLVGREAQVTPKERGQWQYAW